MDKFRIYSEKDVLAFVNLRSGEQKLGEKVQVAPSLDKLDTTTAKFVLIGIPEDIGVRANYGTGGAKTAWHTTLKVLLNIQSNSFLSGDDILLLGEFVIEEPADSTINVLRAKVNQIDSLVAPIIQLVIAAGKIPIVIGGGHNNARPLITGAAKALQQKINVVNIDAHADLRDPKEGRHSGNGFSYAMYDGYLHKYGVFGLHQNYVNQNLPNEIETNKNITVAYFEDLIKSDRSVYQNWLDFIKEIPQPCGLEIDLDGISGILSSATGPSGFSLNEVRKLVMGETKKYTYLHICEGATKLADGREDVTTGKTIAYLVSDFIKALLPRI